MILPPSLSNTDVPRNGAEADLLKTLARAFGLLTILAGITGIIGNISGIIFISTVCPSCKSLALSAALIWIFFGAVLVYTSIKPVRPTLLIFLRSVLVIIACTELIEIVSRQTGGHFIIESWFVSAGSVLFGPLSSPISPLTSALIILAAAGLFFCVEPTFLSSQRRQARESTVVLGIILTLAGFVLTLSYFDVKSIIYGTSIIPIAALSALSAFFIGIGLIAVAGPATVPVRYLTGNSIRATLLRTFVSLSVVITLCETILFYVISVWFSLSNSIAIASSLVIFIVVSSIIVGRLSVGIGHSLDKAERALEDKNVDLSHLNQALITTEEKLRQNIDALTKNDRDLRRTSQYLENLINYANAPIIVWDTEFRILRFNRAFEFLTGMSADTVIGKSLEILFPEKLRSESMERIQRTSSGERWESVEIPVRHVSGGTRIVLWNSANIFDTDGITISSTIAQGLDITDRKIAEESAIKTASLLHAALDSTADGILVVDTARTITGYNKKFCAIWGIPEHTLDGADEVTALAYMTPLVVDCREFTDRRNELYSHPGRESYDVVRLKDGRIFERYSKSQKIGDAIVGRVLELPRHYRAQAGGGCVAGKP